MKRYLSVWLPRWPLEALQRRSPAPLPAEPFALTETGVHGLVIAAVNGAARGQGLHAGLKFTDAKARVPHLLTEEIDRNADETALARLAEWLERFSPRVAFEGAGGLMLETTGCDHLHGGEAALCAALSERLMRAGYTHRIGMASTVGAAFAAARAGQGDVMILAEGGERESLAPLPVKALRISEDAGTLLRRFGLTRIGQLYGLDRKALARRFQSRDAADQVGLRLDQALGFIAEPLKPLRPLPDYVRHLPCPEPIGDTASVTEALRILSEGLGADLEQAGAGARVFRLMAYRADGGVSSVAVRAARPVRSAAHVQRLFREKLERIDPGFGIDFVILEAARTGAMQTGPAVLPGSAFSGALDEIALAALADRLVAKLGAGAVEIAQPDERHLPEAAEARLAYDGVLPPPALFNAQAGPRPQRMFERPERIDVMAEVPDGPPLRFVWRRVVRTVTRADGPERIAPEWWRYVAPASHAERTSSPVYGGGAAEGGGGEIRARRRNRISNSKSAAPLRPFGPPPPQAGEDESALPVSNLPRARDYYRVEDRDGRRYWIFRAGLYEDGRGGAPEWYVHGVFG